MVVSRSSARQRLLDVAVDLFYREGIRSIGVDTIVERSGVGKPTLYRHFSSKNELIAAYLKEQERIHWQWFEASIAPYAGSPKAQLLALIDATVELLMEPGYRGCAFLNALAEFSDGDHPAHQLALQHNLALRSRLCQLGQQGNVRDPEGLADQLLLIINGALTSAPIFGSAGPTAHVKTIAASVIEHQFEHPLESLGQ